MRKAYLIVLFSLFILHSSAQQAWQKSYGTPYTDFPRQMLPLANGEYLLTGQYHPPQFYSGGYLVKTKSNGDSLWTKLINPLDSDISIIPICGYEIDDNNYLIGTSSIK